MVKYYEAKDGDIQQVSGIFDGVWINMTDPDESEILDVAARLEIEPDFIKSALDEEERSRIEIEPNSQTKLIIVDIPCEIVNKNGNDTSRAYETLPLGIISSPLAIITVCLEKNPVVDSFIMGKVKTFYSCKKSRFILQLLYKNASMYLYYLRQLDKLSNMIEAELYRSMRNEELIKLLEIEKSLVYFSTSLKSNEIVLERLSKMDFMKKYEEDTELLDDTIIENKQAIEMAKIYSDILSSTMDTSASIISNNLNTVMKVLASITIIMAIPTIISSFFGMNVPVPFSTGRFSFFFLIIGSIIICFIAHKIMSKNDMF